MRVLQGKTLLVLLCGTGLAYAAYTPYYSDNLTSNGGSWSQNGSVSFGSAGMSSSSGGGLVTGNYPSSYVNDYQVQATIQLPGNTSGGYYGVMFRATSNAYAAGTTGATAQGTFYLAEIQNPTFDSNGNCSATLALNRVINGSVTLLYSGATWCANSFTLGVAVNGSTIVLLQNGYFVTWTTDSGIASGQPGVNVRGAPGGNTIGFTWLGPADKTAPNTIDPHNISATSYSDPHRLPMEGTFGQRGRFGPVAGGSLSERHRAERVFAVWRRVHRQYGLAIRDLHLHDYLLRRVRELQ